MSNESIVKALVQGTEFDDPRLYDLFDKLVSDVYQVYNELHPPTSNRNLTDTSSVIGTGTVPGFMATIFGNNLRLNWSSLADASNYEIRYHSGLSTDWDTATSLLFTNTLQADINPVTIPLIYGNHTFLLKGVSAAGNYSAVAASVVVNIQQITAPAITATVIDNNVLLKWTIPTSSWDIAYYNVYKDGTLQGKMNGTFEVIFETAGGIFAYKVEAVDIVGNVGTSSTLSVTVKQPPDYQIQDSRNSTFSGTKVSCTLQDNKLYACVDIVETFTAHFTARGWSSYNDALGAGYPLMIQPTPLTGSYEEVVDFGALFSNTIVSVLYSTHEFTASVAIVTKIATSTDNITYTGFSSVSSLFAASMRYAKVRLEFTGATDKALISVDTLQFRLDVKRETDSGSVSALAADVGGTAVAFNKTFKSIDSVTLTAQSTTLITVTYASLLITGFKALAFDNTGARVNATVSWKARGIV